MTIIQGSASVDVSAAALGAFNNGVPNVEIGLLRSHAEFGGAMTIRCRRVYQRLPYGPNCFVPPGTNTPNFSFRVIEGGERGGSAWQEAFLVARDWSTSTWGTDVDARIIVQSTAEPMEPVTINAWFQRGPAREYSFPANTLFATDVVTWGGLIQSINVDLSIPPDATHVSFNAPALVATAGGPSIPMPYPFSVVQVDPYGNALDLVVVTGADSVEHVMTLDPNARWIAPINAGLIGGIFPFHVSYKRH